MTELILSKVLSHITEATGVTHFLEKYCFSLRVSSVGLTLGSFDMVVS